MIPPLLKDTLFVYLVREPKSNLITMYVPGGDSYDLSWDEGTTWSRLMGDPEPERVWNYLKNFNTVVYSLKEFEYAWLPREDIDNATGQGIRIRPLIFGGNSGRLT
jgi:hypothetical protein